MSTPTASNSFGGRTDVAFSEPPALQEYRRRRADRRRNGLQYDEAGRPLPPPSPGLLERVRKLLLLR